MIWRCDLVPQYRAYEAEIGAAMQRVFESGRYILAKEVAQFEEEFARYLNVAHGVGVANGTDALTLALLASGVGPGDEVITAAFTAIPTASAIVDAGARPVFVDVDPETFLIDLSAVAAALTKRTRAIVPVHLFGNVVDVPALRQLVGDRVRIVEDACQAHGSTFSGARAGAMGDAGAFSFYPTKNLGAYGDGGLVATNDAELTRRLRLLRTYGMTDPAHIVTDGINSRLDELQAAILRVKLRHLEDMNARRDAVAARYRRELRRDLFEHQRIPDEVRSNHHVFVTRCRGDRDAMAAHLERRGIQTNVYYPLPLPLQEAHRELGYVRGDFPGAERICGQVLALPMYPELPDEILGVVIDAANAFEG